MKKIILFIIISITLSACETEQERNSRIADEGLNLKTITQVRCLAEKGYITYHYQNKPNSKNIPGKEWEKCNKIARQVRNEFYRKNNYKRY